MLKLNLYLFSLCTCLAREPPTVNLPDQGTIMGKEVSMIRTQRIIAYLGIPYAQPPLDRLRFAPPKYDELPRWEGTRNATEYAPGCLQSEEDFLPQDLPFLNIISDRKFEVNESCLFLNVFVPYGTPPAEGFATIVWIHPGNFTSGSPVMWNPYTLVYRQRIIVVTFAYRLNILGFLTTMDGEAPGNYALMDQQAALSWIKKNIKHFEGNPGNICLMGYGSGAMSVGLHMINPISQKFFHKAISMSGNFLNPKEIQTPEGYKALLDNATEYFGCYKTPTSELIGCLRRAEASKFLMFSKSAVWRPMIDAGLSNSTPSFLPEMPKNFMDRDEFHKIPFLTGYTDMEDVLGTEVLHTDIFTKDISEEFLEDLIREVVTKELPVSPDNKSCMYNYNHILDSVLFFYKPVTPVTDANAARKIVTDFTTEKSYGSSTYLQASYMSKESPTYVYRFDTKPSTTAIMPDIPEWVSVPHLFDLIYVWGIPYWGQLQQEQQTEWDIRDKRTSDIIMSFWSNFAKTSNPTETSIYPIRWDPFTKTNPGILIIDRTFNMSDSHRLNYKAFEFWNDYYPKVLHVATQCCNTTDGGANVPRTQFANVFSLLPIIILGANTL